MSDFPGIPFGPRYISSLSPFFAPAQGLVPPGNLSNSFSLNPTADTVYGLPFAIPFPYPAKRFFFSNGGATGDTTEIGLYSRKGLTKIWASGAVTVAGANQLQYTAKDIVIPPGSYVLAVLFHGSFGIGRSNGPGVTVGRMRASGCFQMASQASLPATLTPAAWTWTAMPIIGFTSAA